MMKNKSIVNKINQESENAFNKIKKDQKSFISKLLNQLESQSEDAADKAEKCYFLIFKKGYVEGYFEGRKSNAIKFTKEELRQMRN